MKKKTITEKDIIEKLKEVKDPELGIDIWTLGLIYKTTITDGGVNILMTLTTPFCPFAEDIIADVKKKIAELDAGGARMEVTFEPPWEPSPELRASLGL